MGDALKVAAIGPLIFCGSQEYAASVEINDDVYQMSNFVDRRNVDFLIFELLESEKLFEDPRYASIDKATVTQTLDVAEAIARDLFLSCAGKLDECEPKIVSGKVEIIPEVRRALDAYAEAGLFAASLDEELGGLQYPYLVSRATTFSFAAANISIANYAVLTEAAAAMLSTVGSEKQKQRFVPPMLEGRWFGTMCLSEPNAGSSLADIKTRAEHVDGEIYRIVGNKMWISGGDHELSENIVHMLLAKIPGGPEGVKGISLFIVPKHLINDDGSIGSPNNVELGGLNHKMGHRGTTNCVLNFGESGETLGWLVGEPHRGLAQMFHMMNEARITVGLCAAALGQAGYLYSRDYALERTQGRIPSNKDPSSPPVPIIQHADIKRMLLAQKSAVEGAMGLLFFCAKLVDQQQISLSEDESVEINLLLELLTPIAKSWPSEHCLEANKWAMQILGGYGYTRDFPLERLYRDNRLNHIHEGTFGIHGLDLLGRKVRLNEGRGFELLKTRMQETIIRASQFREIEHEATALETAIVALVEATETVVSADDLDTSLANATLYLDAFGNHRYRMGLVMAG